MPVCSASTAWSALRHAARRSHAGRGPDASLLSLGTSGRLLTNSDGQVVTPARAQRGVQEWHRASRRRTGSATTTQRFWPQTVSTPSGWASSGPTWSPSPAFSTRRTWTRSSTPSKSWATTGSTASSTSTRTRTAPRSAARARRTGRCTPTAGPILRCPSRSTISSIRPRTRRGSRSGQRRRTERDWSGETTTRQMLEYVAHAFNGNPNVAGFELMNEPSPGEQLLPTLLGSPFFDSQQLTPFYDQGADAIRAVDPSTPIFFEPNLLSNAGLPIHLGTRGGPGHGLVVPRLLRVQPGAAGLHTQRQRGRRPRRGLCAGAWNSGIHDASSARPATKRRSRPRCKEQTST